MAERAQELSNRPVTTEDTTDVVSDVLDTMFFRTRYFGRWELGAPWGIAVPQKPTSSFYVVARGALRIFVDGEEGQVIASAGDVVVLPRGKGHTLDDGSRKGKPSRASAIPSEALFYGPRRLGGPGMTTSLVISCFSFSQGAEHPLLTTLPTAMHLRSDDASTGPLAAAVRVMCDESAAPRPGSAFVLGRLADLVLVHALRPSIAREEDGAGLRALADPAIGKALGLMHARPGEPWTVEGLASTVGLSRSGFAARFRVLVGEAPLRYLAQWRITKAAAWLRETDESIEQIAMRAGYESGPAFHKAFKQWRGLSPGAFRRQAAT